MRGRCRREPRPSTHARSSGGAPKPTHRALQIESTARDVVQQVSTEFGRLRVPGRESKPMRVQIAERASDDRIGHRAHEFSRDLRPLSIGQTELQLVPISKDEARTTSRGSEKSTPATNEEREVIVLREVRVRSAQIEADPRALPSLSLGWRRLLRRVGRAPSLQPRAMLGAPRRPPTTAHGSAGRRRRHLPLLPRKPVLRDVVPALGQPRPAQAQRSGVDSRGNCGFTPCDNRREQRRLEQVIERTRQQRRDFVRSP